MTTRWLTASSRVSPARCSLRAKRPGSGSAPGAVAFVPYVRDTPCRHDGLAFGEQFMQSFENTYTRTPLCEMDSARLAFLPLLVQTARGCERLHHGRRPRILSGHVPAPKRRGRTRRRFRALSAEGRAGRLRPHAGRGRGVRAVHSLPCAGRPAAVAGAQYRAAGYPARGQRSGLEARFALPARRYFVDRTRQGRVGVVERLGAFRRGLHGGDQPAHL